MVIDDCSNRIGERKNIQLPPQGLADKIAAKIPTKNPFRYSTNINGNQILQGEEDWKFYANLTTVVPFIRNRLADSCVAKYFMYFLFSVCVDTAGSLHVDTQRTTWWTVQS